jgi:hypothetical protein
MDTTLLTLSFHLPEKFSKEKGNLREDALFKYFGIGSGLLTREAMGNDVPPALLEEPFHDGKPTPASGLESGTYGAGGGSQATQITLLRVGANAWWRKPFIRNGSVESEFEKWLKPHVESPCHCLLLSGHHSRLGDDGGPVLWGAEDTRSSRHRYFTAFVPGEGTKGSKKIPVLTLKGHPYQAGSAVVRGGPFNCAETLKSCRLIVIIGCNGASEGALWQGWAAMASGIKPLVLGWHGVHGMPRDRFANETFSQEFWRLLKALSDAKSPTLEKICENNPEGVIQAWGAALKLAFKDGKQRSLWFAHRERCAGAVDPQGGVWRVSSAEGDLKKDV